VIELVARDRPRQLAVLEQPPLQRRGVGTRRPHRRRPALDADRLVQGRLGDGVIALAGNRWPDEERSGADLDVNGLVVCCRGQRERRGDGYGEDEESERYLIAASS
jgi:hypothetical protein